MPIISNAKILAGSPASILEGFLEFDEGNGRITGVTRSATTVGQKVIDASGLLVLPGAIDCHVHFRDPGLTKKEDFSTGSAAALAGGVTTFADMPNTNPPVVDAFSLREKAQEAKAKSRCDYLLYLGGTPTNAGVAAGLASRPVVAGLKLYLGSSTGSQKGGLLVEENAEALEHFNKFPSTKPIVVHAEDGAMMRQNSAALGGGKSVRDHNRIRTVPAATSSVARAVKLQEFSKRLGRLHLAHLTTVDEVKIVAEARKIGLNVSCEVTPHHLFLSDSDLGRLGNLGKVNPPLRRQSEALALLEELLEPDSRIDMVSSDHAPHLKTEKEGDYANAPSGVPGVQTMLPLLLDASFKGSLALKTVVQLVSGNPSKLLGLNGVKGALQKGADADFVIVDRKGKWRVTGDSLYSKCGWSPFEGRVLSGEIRQVFLGGNLAFEAGQVLAEPGAGKVAGSS
jgi:dihydroorotase